MRPCLAKLLASPCQAHTRTILTLLAEHRPHMVYQPRPGPAPAPLNAFQLPLRKGLSSELMVRAGS